MAKPLIIFDVDGTLIGGESYDWAAFDAAFAEFSGHSFPPGFFDVIAEVTGQAIVRRALPHLEGPPIDAAIEQISAGYADRLAVDIARNPSAFQATTGAVELLNQLLACGYTVAIATGDWLSSIAQKLDAAQIPWSGLPMATCTDRRARAEIITLAAERAGHRVQDAIYVGDGTWDYRATQSLGIPFIGVGKKHAKLHAVGAEITLPDLSPAPFMAALTRISRLSTA